MIEQIHLGGAQVSSIGFGAGPIGGFRGPVTNAEGQSALQSYWDNGGRYYDTAPLYGYGRSELRTGAFLREVEGATISTKVGRYLRAQRPGDDLSTLRKGGLPFWPIFDYTYDGVMRSLEQSMMRTGLTQFDIVLFHDLEPDVHGKDYERHFNDCVNSGYKAMKELRDAGEIKAIGIGVNQTSAARRLLEAVDLDAIMLANRYSLLDHSQEVESFFDLCKDRGAKVLAAAVFNSGILATGITDKALYAYQRPSAEIVEKVQNLQRICADFNVSMPAAAIQFVKAHPIVASVVLGSSNPANVKRNIAMAEEPIPPDFWQALVSKRILPPHLPLPLS